MAQSATLDRNGPPNYHPVLSCREIMKMDAIMVEVSLLMPEFFTTPDVDQSSEMLVWHGDTEDRAVLLCSPIVPSTTVSRDG